MADRLPALRLLVLRHAEAERGAARDFDRALTRKGRADAAEMGKRLAAADLRPDAVLSSPAPRALETAQLAAAALGSAAPPVSTESAIYDASLDSLATVLGRRGGASRCLLLVGHNPGLSELTAWIAGLPADWSLEKASLAHVRLRAEWTDLSRGCGRLVDVLDPP